MNEQQAQQTIERWDELRTTDYMADYERAVFFRDTKRRFPNSPSGTLQFRKWVDRNLQGIGGSKALAYVEMLRSFRTERQWVALGGFSSLVHLMNLTAQQRTRVKASCLGRADRTGVPCTYNIVRSTALRLGYRSTRNGRPTQTEMERKRDILAQFIFDNVSGNIPNEVVEAMPAALREQYA